MAYKVSVLLSVYNDREFIEECLDSVLGQTFSDWEMIIVVEWGCDPQTVQILENYAERDKRFKIIYNQIRLGLAASLNVGLENAGGEYIARVDADDPSYPTRFEKQVTFMDNNQDIVLCGTLQKSVSPSGKKVIQRVPCECEELKASMLFGCEISHCSVMIRREVFLSRGWRYNESALAEDYDLWTQIMFDYQIANIDECLVEHRWGFGNISIQKGEALNQESRMISRRTLQKFGINLQDEDLGLLSGWRSKPTKMAKDNINFLTKGFELLYEIRDKNMESNIIQQSALDKVLKRRLVWLLESYGIRCVSSNEQPIDTFISVLMSIDSVEDFLNVLATFFGDLDKMKFQICVVTVNNQVKRMLALFRALGCRVIDLDTENMEEISGNYIIETSTAFWREHSYSYIAKLCNKYEPLKIGIANPDKFGVYIDIYEVLLRELLGHHMGICYILYKKKTILEKTRCLNFQIDKIRYKTKYILDSSSCMIRCTLNSYYDIKKEMEPFKKIIECGINESKLMRFYNKNEEVGVWDSSVLRKYISWIFEAQGKEKRNDMNVYTLFGEHYYISKFSRVKRLMRKILKGETADE